MRLSSIKLKKVPVIRIYRWNTKDGRLWERWTYYKIGKIDVGNLDVKVKSFYKYKRWLKKIKIKEFDNFVVWKYEGKPDLYIYEDGIFVEKNIVEDREVYKHVFTVASMLYQAGVIDKFVVDWWTGKKEVS